jgi:hypothetical protein
MLLQVGDKVRIGKRTGEIYYVNKQLKVYEVKFSAKYREIISQKKVKMDSKVNSDAN